MSFFKIVPSVFMVLAVFLLNLTSVDAQPKMPSVDDVLYDMKKQINLTDEQMVNIYPIVEEMIEEREALMKEVKNQGRSGVRGMREKMKALQEETDDQLALYLTEKQIQQWKTYLVSQRKERRKKMQGMRQGRMSD